MKKEKKEVQIVENHQDIATKETASVESFIFKAIESNVPVETMEKLFSLREKVKAEQAKEAFISALAKFQAECPVIEKKKVVSDKQGKERYRYAPLDSIVQQVKKALGDNNLSYKFDTEDENQFLKVICIVTHVLGHSQSSDFKIPIDKEDYMTVAQKYASRLTFAKRYAFCNALGILTSDEDTDASSPDREKEDKPISHYQVQILGAKSIKDLQLVWGKMPKNLHLELNDLKEKMKEKLLVLSEKFDANTIEYPNDNA